MVTNTVGAATAWLGTLGRLLPAIAVTDGAGAGLPLDEGAGRALAAILQVRHQAAKMMLVGNGGSAAIVSHMQNDLCKTAGVAAMVFTETPLLTARSNDDGYETAFEQSVRLWARAGDLLLAVSSSGCSENILRAARAARERRCTVITFSGFDAENPLRRMGDLNFYVPSSMYGFVEMAHAALGHYLTDSATAARRQELSHQA